jgi:hypothetical protein
LGCFKGFIVGPHIKIRDPEVKIRPRLMRGFVDTIRPEAYLVLPNSVPRIGPDRKQKNNQRKEYGLYGMEFDLFRQLSFPFFCLRAASMDAIAF